MAQLWHIIWHISRVPKAQEAATNYCRHRFLFCYKKCVFVLFFFERNLFFFVRAKSSRNTNRSKYRRIRRKRNRNFVGFYVEVKTIEKRCSYWFQINRIPIYCYVWSAIAKMMAMRTAATPNSIIKYFEGNANKECHTMFAFWILQLTLRLIHFGGRMNQRQARAHSLVYQHKFVGPWLRLVISTSDEIYAFNGVHKMKCIDSSRCVQ